MIWNEVSPVVQTVLPVAALREHLRLGTGFADDGAQDGLLAQLLRAAIATIERRTGKALLARDFRLKVGRWRDGSSQTLPLAPVTALVSVTYRDGAGVGVPMPVVTYRLVEDAQRPTLATASGGLLPPVPSGGRAEIVFTAGFGPVWLDVPGDLAQAVMMLAAHYHENRHAAGDPGAAVPFGVLGLIEPWRTVRTLGGGRG